MRAALARDNGAQLSVEQVTLRAADAGEVLVRVDAAAICTTDAYSANGLSPSPRPYIPGHSSTGIVEAVGAGVTKARVGDRIITAGTMECGECYTCVRGTPSQCERLWEWLDQPFVVGTTDSDGRDVIADGGVGTLTEQMLFRERCFARVESDLPVEQLALMGCGGISGVGAVMEVGQVRPGDSVVIVGCGHLGLWMIQAARMIGARQVIAIEPLAERRALAASLGATDVIDPADGDVLESVMALTSGRGVDVGLEAAASLEAMATIFDLTRKGGVTVLTSMTETAMTDQLTLPAFALAIYGKQVRSSQAGGGFIGRDLERFTRFVESGLIDAGAMVSATYPLADAGHAMERALRREVISGVVLNQT